MILDQETFQRLVHEPHEMYKEIAATMKALHAEGYVELVDYRSIVEQNIDLIRTMLDRDIQALHIWDEPLEESLRIWSKFVELIIANEGEWPDYDGPPLDRHASHFSADALELLETSLTGPKPLGMRGFNPGLTSEWLRASYLAYVDANLVLSNQLGVGFHDWEDFSPFYRAKFLSIGRTELEGQPQTTASRSLFEVAFPELRLQNPSALLKVLADGRIADLRRLVQAAVDGEVEFDTQFARRTLEEVLQTEWRSARYRRVVSYVTMPLNLIPWVGSIVQKGVEEAVGGVVGHRLRRPYRWFYMLSETASSGRVSRPLRSD